MIAAGRLARDLAESIRGQPARIGLSFLAVMTGIVVLTLLLAMLQGLREESRRMITAFGAQVIAAVPDSTAMQRGGYRGFDQWVRHLSANLSTATAAPMVKLGLAASDGHETPVWAAGASLAATRGWVVTEGRMIDTMDESAGARVALVTEAARQRSGSGPGNTLRIGWHTYTVVGVLQEGSGVPGGATRIATGEPLILIPLATAALHDLPLENTASALFLKPAEDGSAGDLMRTTDRLMQDPAWNTWPVEWITPDTLVRGIRDWQRIIGLAAGSITLLCLLLGGTTLMSLMIADVRQRVPEIGLRRSLGATRGDIALLFIAESMLVTGSAAIAGTLIGGLLLAVLSGHSAIPLGIHFFTFVIPVIVSIVIGIAFSYWPARMAARLSPALALRNA